MQIAIPLFAGLTALDAVGPYEVLQRLPGADVVFLAEEPGAKRTEDGRLALVADAALADVPSPEILIVPGGHGTRAIAADEESELVAWIRSAHERSQWTTSVCTGSLLLGAAGVLQGLRATTHWLSMDALRAYGAEPTHERVVEQGKVITAAGVSAGIDMALRLAELIAGAEAAQALQLAIEYDPEPPFDAGSPSKAPAEIVALVRRAAAASPTGA